MTRVIRGIQESGNWSIISEELNAILKEYKGDHEDSFFYDIYKASMAKLGLLEVLPRYKDLRRVGERNGPVKQLRYRGI